MAFKSAAVPLLSGAALLVGYVAFSWRRRRRTLPPRSALAVGLAEDVEPLSSRLERVPEEQAFDLDLDRHPESGVDAPQLNEHGSEYASHIRALFIARVTEALSPFSAHSDAPNRVGKAS